MELKIGNGKLQYRLPNFPESQRLTIDLGILNVTSKVEDQLLLLANALEKIEKFIELVDVDGINNYQDLLKEPKYANDLNGLVTIIIERVCEFTTQKKS